MNEIKGGYCSKMKFLEWLGFIICLGSMIANGLIRHSGISDSPWWTLTFVSMFFGGMVTIITFLIRKFRNKENSESI
jgi:hypothetical protein